MDVEHFPQQCHNSPNQNQAADKYRPEVESHPAHIGRKKLEFGFKISLGSFRPGLVSELWGSLVFD